VPSIRAYRDDDQNALRAICLRTGLRGQDATGHWSSDDLLPDLYLSPYTSYAPDRVLVVADGADRPIGYLLVVPDTLAFVRWWRSALTPAFAGKYPRVAPTSADGRDEQWFHDLGYEPERMIPAGVDLELERFPAHLHIDLLPEAQGHGLGRALMRDAAARLVAEGVPGIHLSYDSANTGAAAFYDRLGWRAVSPGNESVRVIEPERLLA
jgi:GNAT superfamily N-acetyltransferase